MICLSIILNGMNEQCSYFFTNGILKEKSMKNENKEILLEIMFDKVELNKTKEDSAEVDLHSFE